jgi:hypothetical protein
VLRVIINCDTLMRMLRIGDLTYGEQLILWATRRWLADRACWARVGEEFALALGCSRARAALDALEEILLALHRGARRTIFLHRLDCGRLSSDEHAVLSALAALQEGRPTRARALFEWLLPSCAVPGAVAAASRLAGALAAGGHLLPTRPLGGATRICGWEERAGALVH